MRLGADKCGDGAYRHCTRTTGVLKRYHICTTIVPLSCHARVVRAQCNMHKCTRPAKLHVPQKHGSRTVSLGLLCRSIVQCTIQYNPIRFQVAHGSAGVKHRNAASAFSSVDYSAQYKQSLGSEHPPVQPTHLLRPKNGSDQQHHLTWPAEDPILPLICRVRFHPLSRHTVHSSKHLRLHLCFGKKRAKTRVRNIVTISMQLPFAVSYSNMLGGSCPGCPFDNTAVCEHP